MPIYSIFIADGVEDGKDVVDCVCIKGDSKEDSITAAGVLVGKVKCFIEIENRMKPTSMLDCLLDFIRRS